MGETLEQIVKSGLLPNGVTFIAQLLSTLILFLALKRFVWKPIQVMLEKRKDVIIGELEGAKAAREEAQALKDQYANELQGAKQNALSIVENARSQALETKENILKEAEKEASYKKDKAEKDIQLERARVEKELKAQAIEIAFAAAEKLVNANVDDDKNRQLINNFIQEIGE
jgi:F-type H+-transporting ATPase subunit b